MMVTSRSACMQKSNSNDIMYSIEAEHIVKTYPTEDKGIKTALKDVSFTVDQGELFGIIGPDGAGKTTLFRILTTLLLPDKGSARVTGLDVISDYRSIREQVGYMPGRFSLYQDLSVEENLRFFATIFNTSIDENYGLIRDIYVQIEPFRKRKAGKLSGGMKQKLALCCALIHRPTVLFLDEPTTGVDAVSRKEFWEMLSRLKKEGISILVSTPYMDEAALCDRVALIQDGRILGIDQPKGFVEKHLEKIWEVRSAEMYRLLKDLRRFEETKSVHPFGDFLHLTLTDDQENEVVAFLNTAGHRDILIRPAIPSIEDIFMGLMKTPEAKA